MMMHASALNTKHYNYIVNLRGELRDLKVGFLGISLDRGDEWVAKCS